VLPLKLAKKLNALLIIFWASTTGLGPDPVAVGALCADISDMRSATDVEDSTETPSTSSAPAWAVSVPLTLKTELSFPGPMPPRNLKLGARPDADAAVTSSSVARYIAAAVSGGR